MKFAFLLFAASIISGCTNNDINKASIVIIKGEKHPYLIDHCKKLLVLDSEGMPIDRVELYCDGGNGCNSYLYDTNKALIVIDCNGQWYKINKKSGKISKEKWEWKKQLPQTYLGTFISTTKNKYELIEESKDISIAEVYKYKDPQK